MSRVVVTVVETGESRTMTATSGSIYGCSLGLALDDEPLRIVASGLMFGGLALIRLDNDDGKWRDLFTGMVVTVEPVDMCPDCGVPVKRALVVQNYLYGVVPPLAAVTVTVPEFTCDACGLIYTGHEAEAIRDAAIKAIKDGEEVKPAAKPS